MKLITAILRPNKLADVRRALAELNLMNIIATEIKGVGRQKSQTEIYRGFERRMDFVAKTKLEVLVSDAQLEAALALIIKRANSGRVGDGKIFITDLCDANDD